MLEGGHEVARRGISDFCDITKRFLALFLTFWKLKQKNYKINK